MSSNDLSEEHDEDERQRLAISNPCLVSGLEDLALSKRRLTVGTSQLCIEEKHSQRVYSCGVYHCSTHDIEIEEEWMN